MSVPIYFSRMKFSRGGSDMAQQLSTAASGLEGVVAAETRLSSVDGLAGELIIGGYALEAIADRASFEEMAFLLRHDRLPDAAELARFESALKDRRRLPRVTLDLLREVALTKAPVMDALRMAAGTLRIGRQEDTEEDRLVLIAATPTIVASYWRLMKGLPVVEPRDDLGHAANFLTMLNGDDPSAETARALETYLNTVIDHGLNASTFTARVIASTHSDMVSAIVGAIGALKGPLHGGAPGPALDMVFEIGEFSRAEEVLRRKIENNERLMGFGHRVYKVRDPRADMLAKAAERFFTTDGDRALYTLVGQVEKLAVRLLAVYKPGRRLDTNVEFYTALLLHGIGLPTDLFSPTFALSRVAGWTAHVVEQLEKGRLIRPESTYIGERGRTYTPVEARGTAAARR